MSNCFARCLGEDVIMSLSQWWCVVWAFARVPDNLKAILFYTVPKCESTYS